MCASLCVCASIKSLVDINAKVFIKVLIVECCCLMISIIERLVLGFKYVLYICVCVCISLSESMGELK